MNIELMMKAVNDLKGDLLNAEQSYCLSKFIVCDVMHGKYIRSDVCEGPHPNLINYRKAFTAIEFNELVTELSNWQPTLPKAETAEADGMTYEIGKLYSFKDTAAKDSAIGILLMVVDSGRDLKFLADIGDSHEWFQECKVMNYEIGKITPAPVKLVDGAAYEVTCLIGRFCSVYNKDEAMFYISPDLRVSLDNAEDIIRLVPEVK